MTSLILKKIVFYLLQWELSLVIGIILAFFLIRSMWHVYNVKEGKTVQEQRDLLKKEVAKANDKNLGCLTSSLIIGGAIVIIYIIAVNK